MGQALAQEGAQPEGMSPIIGVVLMLAVVWLFFILPQSRRQKKHTEFLNKLEKGDEVVTQSGLYGKIHGLADRIVTLEVAPNVKVRVSRQSVAGKATADGKEKAA